MTPRRANDWDWLMPLAECFDISKASREHFAQDADREIQNHIVRWDDDQFARKYELQLDRVRAARMELLSAIASLSEEAKQRVSDFMIRHNADPSLEDPSLETFFSHVRSIRFPEVFRGPPAPVMHKVGKDGRREGKYISLADGKELDTQHEEGHTLEKILLLKLCEIASAYGGKVTLGSKENPTGTIWLASEWLRANLPPKSFDRVSPGWLAKVKREHLSRTTTPPFWSR